MKIALTENYQLKSRNSFCLRKSRLLLLLSVGPAEIRLTHGSLPRLIVLEMAGQI
jgi:hypothetical protein